MREGDVLTLADGTTTVITKTYGEQLDEPVIVYNFEVQDFHTYYVTDTGLFVHNSTCNIKSSDPNSYYTYSELKDQINSSGLKGSFESHHLLEKQFADKFKISNADDIISVPLTSRWHRGVGGSTIGQGINIDAKINRELKKITGSATVRMAKASATAEQIWQAHRNVYYDIGQGDWADAIYEAYVKKLGINY